MKVVRVAPVVVVGLVLAAPMLFFVGLVRPVYELVASSDAMHSERAIQIKSRFKRA